MARKARIEASLRAASVALEEQIQFSASVPASDPHLVLVLEAREAVVDLSAAVRSLGLDLLFDAEGDAEADDDYASTDPDAVFPTSLYAMAVNRASIEGLLLAWRRWDRGEKLQWGATRLRDLFSQLKEVRQWGPQDRLQLAPWRVALAGALPDVMHKVEVELWFWGNEQRRVSARDRVTRQLEADGGRVLRAADIPEIGYHALACEVPAAVLLALADGNFAESLAVRSHDVMYFRATGQQLLDDESVSVGDTSVPAYPPPAGTPVVCLLDGVPVTNHSLLVDRVVLHDPDDHASSAAVDDRKHGTAMASVAVWGDLGAGEMPASRPLLVRPVLVPASATLNRTEEFPQHELVPDLMERVFRELFEPGGEASAVSVDVVVVSISIGDPSAPFATLMSSWARALDYLSARYGVLVVVSAGNYKELDLDLVETRVLATLPDDERRAAILDAVARQRISRTLLSPAEAVNAVTVGALHEDASQVEARGYRVDPLGSSLSLSPISALGSGLHRSLKPEVAAPGGRVTFRVPFDGRTTLTFEGASSGPGIEVASPTSTIPRTHTVGTSPAAALVARQAGRIAEALERLLPPGRDRHERAVAVKALLVHGARQPADLGLPEPLRDAAVGHGAIVRDLADGCAPHEATVLYIGVLHAGQSQRLVLPLPDGLTPLGRKRVTATLAWLSPVSWQHRQYRRAKLEFATPTGAGIPLLGTATDVPASRSKRGATTLQHGVWETDRSIAAGVGDEISIVVNCHEQAGGLRGVGVPYAVAMSLWVAPELSVQVYEQVAQQLRAQSAIRPVVR